MHFIFSNISVSMREISDILPEDIGYVVSSNLYFVYIHMLKLVHPHKNT